MSLLKIPFILLESVFTHRIASPPNLTAERARGGLTTILVLFFAAVTRFHRWFTATIEIILILAYHSRILSRITTSWIPRSEETIAVASNFYISPVFILGCFLVWLGSYIRTTSYAELGEQFTFNIGIIKNHKLVTTGIYSIVRHPTYTGLVVGSVGWTLSQFSSGSLWHTYSDAPTYLRKSVFLVWTMVYVVNPLYVVARAPREERTLRKAFPGEWEVYTKRTPYKLIFFTSTNAMTENTP